MLTDGADRNNSLLPGIYPESLPVRANRTATSTRSSIANGVLNTKANDISAGVVHHHQLRDITDCHLIIASPARAPPADRATPIACPGLVHGPSTNEAVVCYV